MMNKNMNTKAKANNEKEIFGFRISKVSTPKYKNNIEKAIKENPTATIITATTAGIGIGTLGTIITSKIISIVRGRRAENPDNYYINDDNTNDNTDTDNTNDNTDTDNTNDTDDTDNTNDTDDTDNTNDTDNTEQQ